jgi:hypothetical protein
VGPHGGSLEEASRLTTAVAWDKESGYFHPFVSQQKYSQFEWGASGSSVAFVVDLVNNQSTELVVAGMSYAVARIQGGRVSVRASVLLGDVTAAQGAVEAVQRECSEDLEALEVTEATADDPAMLLGSPPTTAARTAPPSPASTPGSPTSTSRASLSDRPESGSPTGPRDHTVVVWRQTVEVP